MGLVSGQVWLFFSIVTVLSDDASLFIPDRHRFTAVVISTLLQHGFHTPHTVLHNVVHMLSGYSVNSRGVNNFAASEGKLEWTTGAGVDPLEGAYDDLEDSKNQCSPAYTVFF